MKCALMITAVLGLWAAGFAQDLEAWVEASANPEELQAWLDDLRQNPLDLNRATEAEIAALPFGDAAAARIVVTERAARGGFGDVGEVMALSGLSREQRYAIHEFACVKRDASASRTNSRLTAGCTDISHRIAAGNCWGKGRVTIRSAGGQAGYIYVRRRAADPTLLDQTAVGVELSSRNSLAHIGAGDFQYEAGTGLVFASSYGMANWLSSLDSRKPGQARGLTVRPSSDGRSLFRGIAVDAQWSPVNAVILGSWNRLDAAISDTGAIRITEGETASPELLRARRDQSKERLIGASVQLGRQWWHAGVAGYEAHYSPLFNPIVTAASLPAFSGSKLNTGSLFFNLNKAGVEVIAELAGSRPGGQAFQGAVSVENPHTGVAAYFVSADANFFSPHSKSWGGFGDEANNQRSAGVRVHGTWPHNTLAIGIGSDKTPLRTATSPLSKHSSAMETRWVTSVSDPVEIELLVKRTWSDETSVALPTGTLRVDRGRMDITWRSQEELRIRFEIRSSHVAGEPSHGLGTLLFVQSKARLLDSDVYARVTLFGLEDDRTGSPVQIYESTIAGVYPLVALSGSGRRAAVMISHTWHGAVISVQAAHAAYRTNGADHSALELACGLSYRR